MKGLSLRSLVYVALFSAIFIVFSALQIKLSISVVPITLQTLAVMLAGIFLKPRQAFLSILIVIILGAIGLPVFAGKSGLVHIFGPTGGFIFAFPFGAMLISYFVQKGLDSANQTKVKSIVYYTICLLVLGLIFPYVIGVPWFMVNLNMGLIESLMLSCVPYLIGDVIKVIVALLILFTLNKNIRTIRFQQLSS